LGRGTILIELKLKHSWRLTKGLDHLLHEAMRVVTRDPKEGKTCEDDGGDEKKEKKESSRTPAQERKLERNLKINKECRSDKTGR